MRELRHKPEFLPVLDAHFGSPVLYTGLPSHLHTIYYRLKTEKELPSYLEKSEVIVGNIKYLDNISTSETVSFLATEVSEILQLARLKDKFRGMKVYTNLVTHHHEIKKLGYDCVLMTYHGTEEIIKIPDLESRGYSSLTLNNSIVVNPDLESISDILCSEWIVVRRDPYRPRPENYNNEYNSYIQAANIMGARVWFATNEIEMEIFRDKITSEYSQEANK